MDGEERSSAADPAELHRLLVFSTSAVFVGVTACFAFAGVFFNPRPASCANVPTPGPSFVLYVGDMQQKASDSSFSYFSPLQTDAAVQISLPGRASARSRNFSLMAESTQPSRQSAAASVR